MSAMASQITILTIVYSTVFSSRRSKKTLKLRVTGLCEENSPVTDEFPHKGPVTRKMFPFDDVIMWQIFPEFIMTQFPVQTKLSHDVVQFTFGMLHEYEI